MATRCAISVTSSSSRTRFERAGFWICTALLLAACGADASTVRERRPNRPAANPDLSPAEITSIASLFQELGNAFIKKDAQTVALLFAVSPDERGYIETKLRREFEHSQYCAFEVQQILPDDKLLDRRHSVDVQIKFCIIKDGVYLSNSTIHNFIVQKRDDGSFAMVHSEFFDNLGLRQSMNMLAEALLAIIVLSMLLAFWVWMGLEVFRSRPRSRFWRVMVFFPLLGALAFFLSVWLPRQLKR